MHMHVYLTYLHYVYTYYICKDPVMKTHIHWLVFLDIHVCFLQRVLLANFNIAGCPVFVHSM